MHDAPRWLLFADVDGSLWCQTETDAVLRERIRRAMGIARVILASSRTVEQLLDLQVRLGVELDLIAENGGQLVTRDLDLAQSAGARSVDGSSQLLVQEFGSPLEAILPTVVSVARGHGVEDVLPTARGWPAHNGGDPALPFRRSSLLLPTEQLATEAFAGFANGLREEGLDVINGRRWTSISKGSSKGEAARVYIDAIAQKERAQQHDLRSAAIGNSDNDESILRLVDLPLVVRNPEGHAHALEGIPGAVLLQRIGCACWDEAIERLERERLET